MYGIFVKRILDFIAAAALLVLLSWLFLILAALIAARLGTPSVFRQERPGRVDPKTGRERIFTMYKFRTMTDARYNAEDERAGKGIEGELLPDEDRLTPFGRKLRSTSLDELPELVNILKGDMSFIGPRPLLVKYLPRYSAEQARRHEVRPGLTGLAQVSGRNAITWEEKFAYDARYVDKLSFALDCHILAATFRAVVKREGIAAEGEATMPEFMGSDGGDAGGRE
ncbi:MAG: sugar transferase [Clostridiales Family XIII bacterium]|jgi:lipopolysaccharide/colanic/teichoic acid biosynthesis glycosyltransferase|nr:sugar transferase [Clostridiales Family XIII bacterium]